MSAKVGPAFEAVIKNLDGDQQTVIVAASNIARAIDAVDDIAMRLRQWNGYSVVSLKEIEFACFVHDSAAPADEQR